MFYFLLITKPTISSSAVSSPCGRLKCGLGEIGACGAPTDPAVGAGPAGRPEAAAAARGCFGSLQQPEGDAPHSDRQGKPGTVGVDPAGAETRGVEGRAGAGERRPSTGKEMKISVDMHFYLVSV